MDEISIELMPLLERIAKAAYQEGAESWVKPGRCHEVRQNRLRSLDRYGFWVYKLIGEDGTVLYVGKTSQIFKRLGEHQSWAGSKCNAPGKHVPWSRCELIECNSDDEATYIEESEILRLRPKGNFLGPDYRYSPEREKWDVDRLLRRVRERAERKSRNG